MEKEEKPVAFNLVIDKDRHKVLNMIIGGYQQMDDGRPADILMRSLEKQGVADVFLDLLDELGDKVHELDWCEDPDCQHNEE